MMGQLIARLCSWSEEKELFDEELEEFYWSEELTWSEILESGIVEDHVSELTTSATSDTYSDILTVTVDSGASDFSPMFSSTPHR